MKEKVVDWGAACREPQCSVGEPGGTSNDRQDSGEGDPGAGQSLGGVPAFHPGQSPCPRQVPGRKKGV